MLEFHPIADLFPLMPTEGKEWEKFCDDICKHGLRNKILLHSDGRILDGRNRYRACLETHTQIEMETFDGADDEAIEIVLSLNLHRRHLNESQRAMVGARLATMHQGGDRRSENFKVENPTLKTVDIAKRLQVSRDQVFKARRILKESDEDTVRAIDCGQKRVATEYRELSGKNKTLSRKDRVIKSEEEDLIEAIDKGKMSATAAYDELQSRIKQLATPPSKRVRKLVPIEEFVRDMIRRISSVVRTGRLDAIVDNSESLSDFHKRDTALALRDMAKVMLEKAEELWPSNIVDLEDHVA